MRRYASCHLPAACTPFLVRVLSDDEPAARPASGDKEVCLVQLLSVKIRNGTQADVQPFDQRYMAISRAKKAVFPL